jgi:hypothetical protein
MYGSEVVANILMTLLTVIFFHVLKGFHQFRLLVAQEAEFGGDQFGKGSVGSSENRTAKVKTLHQSQPERFVPPDRKQKG